MLITLGITGIIAAMTVPSVIKKNEKNITAVRLKKFYSVMQNVIRLSEYENGEMFYWEFPQKSYDKEINIFFQKYYLPYLNKVVECYSSNCFVPQNYEIKYLNGQFAGGVFLVNYFVKLTDGTYIFFLPNTPNGYIWMFVDLNGHQKPNQIGKDIFVFDIYGYNDRSNRKNYKLKFWGAYLKTNEELTGVRDYGCNVNAPQFSGYNCGELILRNNWTIPDYYPW